MARGKNPGGDNIKQLEDDLEGVDEKMLNERQKDPQN